MLCLCVEFVSSGVRFVFCKCFGFLSFVRLVSVGKRLMSFIIVFD